jgi:5'-nucleotidase
MYKETVYNDPIEAAQDMIYKKKQHCDLVICLSHLGYKYRDEPNKLCDLKLAEMTQDIDLIIGGHTHTFLDKPTVVKNQVGKEVLVNQVGCYGINLGRIDFYLDNDKAKSFEGNRLLFNSNRFISVFLLIWSLLTTCFFKSFNCSASITNL